MATLFLLLWSIASAFHYLEQFLGARKIPAETTPIVQFSPEKFPPRKSSTLDSSSHKLGKEASGENFLGGNCREREFKLGDSLGDSSPGGDSLEGVFWVGVFWEGIFRNPNFRVPFRAPDSACQLYTTIEIDKLKSLNSFWKHTAECRT